MNYLLYNPIAHNGKGPDVKKMLKELNGQFPDIEDIDYTSILYEDFVKDLQPYDNIVLAGGDGTINFFANDYKTYPCPEGINVYLLPIGTGNDFVNDIIEKDGKCKLYSITKYLEHLPKVRINGHESYFINNVGYGLDGEVCEMAEELKSQGKKVNYTAIALTLLKGKYIQRNAKITCDGVTEEFKEVWVAPAMNGKYYGGGMKAAPSQDRLSGMISCPVMFGQSRGHTIKAFAGIGKGTHIKHTEMIKIFVGKYIKVEFDTPCAIQVDGEVTLNVSSYEAWIEE